MCAVSVGLGGCARSRADRVEAALMNDQPPADFWLAVTVLRPVPLGALINARTEPERSTVPRPARYVVEADAILRVAVGYGATERTFPPETRQLSAEQVRSLWQSLRASELTDPGHPNRTGKLPTLEEFSVVTEGRGGYSLSYSVEGERRILAIDEAAPAAKEARALVEQLAGLAWIAPRKADAPEPATMEPSP
jgi:hypothetical protein